MNNILIVEDEHLIARLIEMTLTRAGYRCTLAEDGRTAADLIETTNFDMALLDIMLPGLDGYALLECLRPQGVPVIFITAKSAVKDRVQGLRLGADDYITKPFAAEELVARMETVLRRTGRGGRELCAYDVVLDTVNHTARRNGEPVELRRLEYDLLELLMRNRGAVEKVWDMARYVVAFEQWVRDEKIAFVASHYDGFAKGVAGKLDSMLIPAFSMLIKQGTACAVEGDIKVAMAMSILKTIAGCGQLSEMYSIDFNEDICIIGHSGSGDADISTARKPTMKIVPVFHGKTGGGYLTQFYPPVGDVTYLAITQDKDGHFKFVVAEGVNEPGPIFTFGDTNMRTRFSCGAREFVNRWSEAGPTHHMAAATGHHIDTILKVAEIFNVPVDVITR